MVTALLIWIAIEVCCMRYMRYEVDLGSPVCRLSLNPKSKRNDFAFGPMGSRVSTATGMNVLTGTWTLFFPQLP